MANLEEISNYQLESDRLEMLFAQQRSCVVCWTTSDGWPVGVTHRYVRHDGKFWVTTSRQRHRVRALSKRPRSCIVISGEGTDLGPDCTATFKTLCTVRDDRETKEWFYRALSAAMHPDNEAAQQGMIAMFDTPRRVILELDPIKMISYDGGRLAEAIGREGLTT